MSSARSAGRSMVRGALQKLGEPSSSRLIAPAALRAGVNRATSRGSGRIPTRYLSTSRAAPYASSAPSSTPSGPSSAPSSSPIPEIGAEDTYDIVIIGGANAGLALACALLAKPTIRDTTRVLLIEGGSLERVRAWKGDGPWENRISSLTSENVRWLESIGVWPNIISHRSCPVEEMVIWANPSPSSTPNIHFPPLGHPMARMTENTNLQHALLRTIESSPQSTITIAEESRVTDMQLGPGGRWVGLQIGGARWVRGGVVVGADGPNSPVRHFSGIESFGHGYETHAVVATLHHDVPSVYPNNTAFQRFLPTGPIAFLPLSPTASTMVWSTLPHHAAAYKRLSPEALVVMVNAAYAFSEDHLAFLVERILAADAASSPLDAAELRTLIGSLPLDLTPPDTLVRPSTVTNIPEKSIASFPLRLSHAEEYIGDRTVLVGDAAHTIHPLAGQGLNMGLADVRVLADTWETARRLGSDLGSRTTLAPYPRVRYPLNHLMLSTTDHLHHIFRNRSGPLNWLRGVGLDVINELGPLKKALMEGAGAGASGQKRTEHDIIFGPAPGEKMQGRTRGWPVAMANGLEGWRGFKQAAGMAAGMAGDVAKGGLRRAADLLERRR